MSDADEIRSPIVASWVLLIVTCLVSVIPFIGFISWILGGVTITIAIVLAIVVISKGGTWHGIIILLVSMIVVPCIILVAPIVSSLIAGYWLDQKSVEGPGSGEMIEFSTESESSLDASEAAAEATESVDAAAESVEAVESAVEAEAAPGAANEKPPED